jgi:signal transduction histidine kinase
VHVETDAEVHRLRAVMRDLVALSAIPAAWIGSDPPVVVTGLADTLIDLLQLDFAFVRLSDPGGAEAIEVTRGNAWTSFPGWLKGHLAARAPFPRKEIVPDVGDSERRRGFVVPVGISGEGGVVVAVSERSDFPTSTEEMLLSLAANHAAAAFQSARLIHERTRAEEELRKARNELELKVAERTAELQVANDELRALRHVATLVAGGVEPQDLFPVVAKEVTRVINATLVSVVRYEPDGTTTECARLSPEGPPLPVGRRWTLERTNVLQRMRASSEAARIDHSSGLEGEIADTIPRRGIGSTVGIPIVVSGLLWGAMVVSSTDPLPQGTEARLAEFTELLATALANVEAREALERLAEEQAALRRVATLVARGVRPPEIFSAVSDELAGLFGSAGAVLRFEHDPPAVVSVGISKSLDIPIGTRWTFQDGMASAEVYRTGRSARIDARDWSSANDPVGAAARRLGVVSTVVSPIVVEDGLWGAMSVSSTHELLPPNTEERLEKFTELVATAIANAESRSELAASRRRIVAASDEARRRIERDLHDGTQQRLVSLGLALRSMEADVPPDRDDLRMEVSTVETGLADAVKELQELSRGIHPAILSRGGLGPALRTLARRSAIPVELEVTVQTRLPEPIEVAAYYVASEALANATKHARASRIEVSLGERNGRLLLSVRDDGIGGVDPSRGSGLVGLTDRVDALGGSIRVESRRGEGTHVTAELPLEL